MITSARTNPNIFMDMTEAGYSNPEIPDWVKRPTPEQIADRSAKRVKSVESTQAGRLLP